MQLANAALGSTGTAGHLIFRPFDRSFFRGIVTFHHRLDSILHFYRWSWRVFRIAFPLSKARPLMLSSYRIFGFQGSQPNGLHLL